MGGASSTRKSKILLIFCDGTGEDGNLSAESSGPHNSETKGAQYPSNVLRLSRAVKELSTDERRQIVYYQCGVGSEADFYGKPADDTTMLQSLGTAVASKIRDAYAFIAQNFIEGDQICMFGFSRGAYTVRKVAGLIDKIGLLQTQSLGHFYAIWNQLLKGDQPTIPSDTRRARIRCVGVWDTVGAVFNTIDALNIKDTSLPPIIDCALHALSIQENRKKYLPTLWTPPSTGLAKLADGTPQVLKQVWFVGAHSNVGGGYGHQELADLTLFWMAGEIEHFINLDLRFLRESGQRRPDPWGTSLPRNAYEDLSASDRPYYDHETRLEGGQITADAIFHPSLELSPSALPDPRYMVTFAILQEAFGPSWKPTFSTLNAFEAYCKAHWGQPATYSLKTLCPTPKFESLSELFASKHDASF